MTTPLIRILVVEDNLLTRLGIVSLIETQPTMKLVGLAEDGAKAVTLYAQLRPDVVICDLRLPKLDGWQVLELLRRATPPARVLVLTNFDGEEDVFRALQSGALGFLSKDADGIEVLEAVRAVNEGRTYVPTALAERFEARAKQQSVSARELQVLDRIARGLSNREIAQELKLSEKTVEMYVTSLLGKLGAKSRTDAVVIALQRGLLSGRARG